MTEYKTTRELDFPVLISINPPAVDLLRFPKFTRGSKRYPAALFFRLKQKGNVKCYIAFGN